MARTVEGSGAPGEAQFVVAVGIEAVLAADLAQARGISLRPDAAQPIGPGSVVYTHFRAHETVLDLVRRLSLAKNN